MLPEQSSSPQLDTPPRESAPSSPQTLSWTASSASIHPYSHEVIIAIIIGSLGMTVFGLVQNSPVMAITFILLALVTYLQSRREPTPIKCLLSSDGIAVDNALYSFQNISSFSFDIRDAEQILVFRIRNGLTRSVHIPLGDTDISMIRSLLRSRLPETRYEPSLLDILANILRI